MYHFFCRIRFQSRTFVAKLLDDVTTTMYISGEKFGKLMERVTDRKRKKERKRDRQKYRERE